MWFEWKTVILHKILWVNCTLTRHPTQNYGLNNLDIKYADLKNEWTKTIRRENELKYGTADGRTQAMGNSSKGKKEN